MIQAVPKSRSGHGDGLLVVRRQPEQGIRIGSDVYVKILGVEGDRVVVGIGAPRDVRIYREELLRTLTPENYAADHRSHLERLARLCHEVGFDMVPKTRPAAQRAA